MGSSHPLWVKLLRFAFGNFSLSPHPLHDKWLAGLDVISVKILGSDLMSSL